MRILIFGHTAFYNKEITIQQMSNGGGWMDSLIMKLHKLSTIQLGLADGSDNINYVGKKWEKECQHNIEYYHWPYHKKRIKEKISDLIHYNDVSRDKIVWPYYLDIYKQVIEDFKPDVIHVFGSEVYLQLAAIAAKGYPLVLHAQGLLSLYVYILCVPGISKRDYILKDGICKVFKNFQELVAWNRGAYREKAILSSVPHVIGRTTWDKQALEILAPQAKYHYGGELLRPIFYESIDRIYPATPIIITTLSSPLYKGYDLILKIADILKYQLHLDFTWKVFGGPNAKFFENKVGICHNDVNVEICGRVSAEEIKRTMCNATVYVQSSYIENSPNSLAEAQICGLPVVATNVGGTSSMLEDGVSGLLFPATDPYMGAYCIKELITNRERNIEMGKYAKEIAYKRHDPDNIVASLIQTYKEIIDDRQVVS